MPDDQVPDGVRLRDGNRIKVNPTYLYEGNRSRRSLPPRRRIAIFLTIVDVLLIVIQIATDEFVVADQAVKRMEAEALHHDADYQRAVKTEKEQIAAARVHKMPEAMPAPTTRPATMALGMTEDEIARLYPTWTRRTLIEQADQRIVLFGWSLGDRFYVQATVTFEHGVATEIVHNDEKPRGSVGQLR